MVCMQSPDGPVASMAWDPTGTLLATGASEGTIKVWDICKVCYSFNPHTLRTAAAFCCIAEPPYMMRVYAAAGLHHALV